MSIVGVIAVLVVAVAVGYFVFGRKDKSAPSAPASGSSGAASKSFVAPPPKTSTKKVAEKKPAAKKDAAATKKAPAPAATSGSSGATTKKTTKKKAPVPAVDYSALTKDQLLAEAQRQNVTVAKSWSKDKIITAMSGSSGK